MFTQKQAIASATKDMIGWDEAAYLENKAQALIYSRVRNPTTGRFDNWTADQVLQAIHDVNMDPWTHFITYGAFETPAVQNGYKGISPNSNPYFDWNGFFLTSFNKSVYFDESVYLQNKTDASMQCLYTLLGQGWDAWGQGLGGSQAAELMLQLFSAFNLVPCIA
jgi:hypothetical protein